MFVLHLLLLFDLVFCSWDYEVSSYPSYSSINYGLFNKFNRHEPFVLFRTKYGLQQLTGNGTCYTPKSIYQPSTNLIDYWEYSIDDNYIGWVNKEINQYCSKNLFNDHWNDAYVWDIKNECLQMGTPGKLQTASHFSLSVSRKVVYIIFKSGDIQVASVRNSTCMFFLSDTPYESPSALHITNFIFKQDRLLIGDQSRRIIYAMSPGANEFIGQLNLTDPDELMMIDSDQRGHIYIAVKRYNRSLVLQYDHSLSNHSILFETNEDEEIRSISATNYNLAVLVKSNASFTNESTNSNDTIFLLHLITLDTKTSNNVNQSNDTNTIFTCHVDHSDESILSVTLVDIQMKTMKKKICKENNALCLHSVGQCKPKSLFQLIPQIRFNTDKIHNELCAKLILSLILTIFTIFLFPYLCYRNGGGTFLIPYVLSLIFLGLSYFFFETSIGQFTQLGPIKLWKILPIFRGIGYAMFIMNMYVSIYYNMVIAWALYYIYSSFTAFPNVPWAHCHNQWNTEMCLDYDQTRLLALNITTNTPSQEYFYNHVLEKSSAIGEMGHIKGHLALCLAIAWLLVIGGLCLGAKSLGKVSYFTAIFPYVMITALLIKGATLNGAKEGILHYIKPDFSQLANISTWSDAATQIFFSLSICYGGVITLASYNPYYDNTIKNSIVIVVCNSLTSIYAGFAIFSVIGFMAHSINKPINEATDQGVGLAFVAYPAALSRLPMPWLWSAIFFFMLIVLGFGSQMTIVETIVMNLNEIWPSKLHGRKPYVLVVVCFLMYLAGLPMCTNAGIYILHLMDNYSVPYAALVIGFFEMVAIAWVYGIERHLKNIHKMMGFPVWPHLYWKCIAKFACPIIMATIFTLILVHHSPLTYNDYVFPTYSNVIGWILTLSSVIMIPIFALYEFSKVWLNRATYKDIINPDVKLHEEMTRHSVVSDFQPAMITNGKL